MGIKSWALKLSSNFVPFARLLFSDKKDPPRLPVDRGGSGLTNAAKGASAVSEATPLTDATPLVEGIVNGLASHSTIQATGPVTSARPLVDNERGR